MIKFTSLPGTLYRTEYNVFIAVFLYLGSLKPANQQPVDSRLLFLFILLVSIVLDLFWYLVVAYNWEEDTDLYWEKERGWYKFGLVWVGLNMLVKVVYGLYRLEL